MSYYSGGSGYVLSRGAFTRLMREGLLLPGPRRCAMPHTRAEGISNYPPEWYSINEDVQVIIYNNICPPIYLTYLLPGWQVRLPAWHQDAVQ